MNTQIKKVMSDMRELAERTEEDFRTSKKVDLVESNLHTFMFEVDKKEGDAGVRKSQN